MKIRVPETTKAEKSARTFAGHYSGLDPARFEVEVSVSPMSEGTRYSNGTWMILPDVSVSVSMRDLLTGGSLWAMWLTRVGQEGKPGSTQFLGGYYRWTSTGRERRIRKSMPHLYRIASVFAHE